MSDQKRALLKRLLSLVAREELENMLLHSLEVCDDVTADALILGCALSADEADHKEDTEPRRSFEELITRPGEKFLRALKVSVE